MKNKKRKSYVTYPKSYYNIKMEIINIPRLYPVLPSAPPYYDVINNV